MFRLWGKVIKDNRLLWDYVYENDCMQTTRTKKVFDGLECICKEYDLSVPIWLDSNINEFKRADKTRFNSDRFIDHIDFDFLEIHVIEE